MISQKTAMDIALAYREVETAQKLLSEIADVVKGRGATDIRDAFGRHQDGLQLGVPSGANGHRLFNVPWSLAQPIIEAHIANQQAIIAALNEKAIIEATAFPTEALMGFPSGWSAIEGSETPSPPMSPNSSEGG